MKSKLSKSIAAALVMTMCVPVSAFAADATATTTTEGSGSFNTSFDLYSPALTIQVPVNAQIRVNPLADTSATGVKKFSVASNSIDIWNASVDVEADTAIPVNATVKATITSKKDDVVTEYNTFTASPTSTKKRINLNLSEAQTAAVVGPKTGGAQAFDGNKKLDFSTCAETTAAIYTTPKQSVPITQYGSLLSVDIAGPATADSTAGKTFSSDATKLTAKVGSFAVTGVANASADWKADDIAVAITYDVRASQARAITTPTIGTAPTFNSASPADVVINLTGVGEATVDAMALHNDEGTYGEFFFEEDGYKVEYPSAGTAKITIPKENKTLTFLAGDDYKTKPQDLIIALSDGRRVVSTLTAN